MNMIFFINVKMELLKKGIEKNILKLVAVERYGNNNIVNAFIKGFNLEKGAIAFNVTHYSHNIIVLGKNSKDMTKAVNLIREN